MNDPSRRTCAVLLGLASAGFAASACSGDDETQAPRPATPPTMQIVTLTAAGGPQWKQGDSDTCIERGRDDAGTVVLGASLTDFVLRPPGTCSVSACGQLLIRIDPSGESELQRVDAAQTSVDLAFKDLPDGSHVLRAELHYSTGKAVLGADKNPVVDEVTIDLRPVGGCGGATDAGTDATPDATPDAPTDGSSGDASSDAEAGTDAGTDAPSDAPSDASDANDANTG